MDFQTFDWGASLLAILPEILLTILAVAVLALDVVWPESRRRQLGVLMAAAMVGVLALTLLFAVPPGGEVSDQLFLGGMIRHDTLTQIFRTMVILAGALTCLISVDVKGVGRNGTYYALVTIATVGASLMSAAADLIMVFVALETTSISLYMLAGFLRGDERSSESGLKYFLFGAFTSAITLYGLSLLYGFSGQTNIYLLAQGLATHGFGDLEVPVLVSLIMVVVGFGFKVSAVPFHFWTPDVYEGAPTPITAFISVASKAASFALLMRFFMAVFPTYDEVWVQMLAVLALMTMTLGNVLALAQRNVKRLLAYSSIAQAGYALIGVVSISSNAQPGAGMAAVAFYMFMYVLTNVAAFTVVILTSQATGSEAIADLAGLSRRSPWLALAMTVALLSLGGIPPAAGFFGKFFLFNAAVDSNLVWLALVGVLNAIVALYYYLMIIKVMYVDRSDHEDRPIAVSAPYRWALLVTTLGVILLGVVASPVYDWAVTAGRELLKLAG